MITPTIAAKIRVLYASCLYSNTDLFLDYSRFISFKEFTGVLNYEVLPEVNENLRERVEAVETIQEIISVYRAKLLVLAEADVAAKSGIEDFEEMRTTILKETWSKLKVYPWLEKSVINKSHGDSVSIKNPKEILDFHDNLFNVKTSMVLVECLQEVNR